MFKKSNIKLYPLSWFVGVKLYIIASAHSDATAIYKMTTGLMLIVFRFKINDWPQIGYELYAAAVVELITF